MPSHGMSLCVFISLLVSVSEQGVLVSQNLEFRSTYVTSGINTTVED